MAGGRFPFGKGLPGPAGGALQDLGWGSGPAGRGLRVLKRVPAMADWGCRIFREHSVGREWVGGVARGFPVKRTCLRRPEPANQAGGNGFAESQGSVGVAGHDDAKRKRLFGESGAWLSNLKTTLSQARGEHLVASSSQPVCDCSSQFTAQSPHSTAQVL